MFDGEELEVEVNCSVGLTLPVALVTKVDDEEVAIINMQFVRPHERAFVVVDETVIKMFEDGLLLLVEEKE